jgi:hypothetical protein
MASRRFPLPWIVEETAESLCILDEPTSMPWANMDGGELAKDEACHVAAHFAKLPELLKRPPQ